MAWKMLPTDYTDAVWSGLKKYSQIDNSDGTVSFQDVTVYSGKERSFFGAKDANQMNEALNSIMSMVENGTDLYEAFQTYFEIQKTLFDEKGQDVIESLKANTNIKYDSFVEYIESLKKSGNESLENIETDFQAHMTNYEVTQKALFNQWFENIKATLSSDVAGNLQEQITEINERLANIEYMVIQNDYSAPITVDETKSILLVDDLGNAILADWKI